MNLPRNRSRGSAATAVDPSDPAALRPEEIAADEAEFEDEEGATLDRQDLADLGPGAGTQFRRKTTFGGIEEDGMGGRWPAPR